MRPGSRVVVLDDPLNYGVGAVVSVERDGKVRVEFSVIGEVIHRESFDPFDLELLDVWEHMDTLSDLTLAKLRSTDTPH